MQKFVSALTAAAVTYGVTLTEERIAVYWELLSPFGEDALVSAIRVYLTLPTSRFFPVPADLVAVMAGEVGNDEGAGDLAFGRISRVSSDSHAVAQITDADPAARAALDALGGWYAFSNSDEDPKYQRRTFSRAYATAAKRLRLGLNTDGTPRLGSGDERKQIGSGDEGQELGVE